MVLTSYRKSPLFLAFLLICYPHVAPGQQHPANPAPDQPIAQQLRTVDNPCPQRGQSADEPATIYQFWSAVKTISVPFITK